MGGGRIVERRDAHEPPDPQAEPVPAFGDESVSLARRDPGLLRLLAGVDLNEEPRGAALTGDLGGERPGDFRTVHRLDDIEQGDRFFRLVGLERADEVEFYVGPARLEGGPFRLSLLHPVLAEPAVAGLKERDDRFRGMGLGDSDDACRILRPAGLPRRRLEAGFDPCEVRGDVGGFGRHGFQAELAVSAESLRTRAAKLAAAARRLKSAGGARAAQAPFSLAFMTDAGRGPDAILAARALPAGAALILRDYGDPRRLAKARALAAICAARGVIFLVGGDPALASASGAGGVHLRSDQLRAPPAMARGLIVTAACHAEHELACAAAIGAAAAFLSPVFETRSHPDAAPLGPEEFKRLANLAQLPVLALGGVDETNAMRLAGANVAGFGAIGAFNGS